MRNKHPKREMAIKMLSQEERARGTSVFNSVAWIHRKLGIVAYLRKKHPVVYI